MQAFPPPSPDPGLGAGERKGRGGRSAVLRRRRARSPRRASCAATRLAPARCAPASRFRAPRPRPRFCALNADEGALRDLRFAVGDDPGPAAKLLRLWRDLAGRPPSLDPGRLAAAAARLDLAVDPNGLAASLKACAGEGDPVSAAAKAAAAAFSAVPDAPAAEAEILALWVFDIAIAIRLRWPRPVPLIAMKILDPTLRSPGAGRRPRPGDPAWPNAAASAIALAAASALDLAADLAPPLQNPDRRRAQTALETGGQNRRPPAQPRLRLARRSGAPGADDRPRRPPAVRPARCPWRRARVFGPAHIPAIRPVSAASAPPSARERRKPRRRACRPAPGRPLARMDAARRSRRSSPRKNPWRARRSSAWSAKPAGSTI